MTQDMRVVNTPNLERLIETAQLLGFNQYPESRRLRLEPGGLHVCQLLLFNHKGQTNRDIVHHRIRVMAKVFQPLLEPLEPAVFLLDVRASDWEALLDVESMHRALTELEPYKDYRPVSR